jgi:hypothetical protein
MLASAPGTRVVYEPANVADELFTGEQAALVTLPRSGDPCVKDIVRALSGRLWSPWTDQMNTSHLPRRSVVKDVRALWLVHDVIRQQPEVPVIVLSRHPYDVARSAVELGWCDPQLTAAENFAAEVASWCAAYDAAVQAPVIWVSYEDLCADPQRELRRLREALRDRHPTWEALEIDSIDVGRWSQTNFRHTQSTSREAIPAEWIECAAPVLLASPWSHYYAVDGSTAASLPEVIGGLH